MATKKLLLKESVRHVGKVGDVVEVSAGFARNYLIPHHLAVEPTPNNVKKIEARRQEIERQERELRAEKEALIAKLQGTEVTLERKTNDQGHLFGSVAATDIAKALQGQGFNIEAPDVHLPGAFYRIDTYTVRVSLAEDLSAEIKVWVAPDAESKVAIDHAQKTARKNAEAAAAASEEK